MLLIDYFKICGMFNILCKWWRQKLRHNLLFTKWLFQSICSSARHQTPSRHHLGLQIVQTSKTIRLITRYGAFFRSGFTAEKSKMWTSCDRASLRNGNAWTSRWSTMQSNSGVDVFALVCLRWADISSKCYNVLIWHNRFNCVKFTFVKCVTIFKFICCTLQ